MELTKEHQRIDKLSQFVRAAVRECDALSENEEYRLSSEAWHSPPGEESGFGPCTVCLAGAIMAAAADDSELYLQPDDFPNPAQERLDALDRVRRGDIRGAVLEFYGQETAEECKIETHGDVRWRGSAMWRERARVLLLKRAKLLEEAGY